MTSFFIDNQPTFLACFSYKNFRLQDGDGVEVRLDDEKSG